MNEKNVKIFKIIILLLILSILCYLTVRIMPIFENLSSENGRIQLKNEIENLGFKGILMLVALMAAQIFLAILPGEPIEILAGMCFGTVQGTILVLITVFVITSLIFGLVKKYGKKFIYGFFSKERIKKIEKSKVFNNPKIVETIIFILFLIPGTPKDFLIYVGGILPIKPLSFILISTFARIPSIVSSTIAGENLLDGNVKIIALVYIITFTLAGVVIFLMNKFDKNKVAQKAIDEIK